MTEDDLELKQFQGYNRVWPCQPSGITENKLAFYQSNLKLVLQCQFQKNVFAKVVNV